MIWEYSRKAWLLRRRLVATHWPMVLLFAGFVTFLRLNGGVVVGDTAAHKPSLHLVQVLYCAFIVCGSQFAVHFSPIRLAALAKEFAGKRTTHKLKGLALFMASLLACVVVIKW